MKKTLFIVLSMTLFMTACEDPAANKVKATVSDPINNSAANAPSSNSAANVLSDKDGLPILPENSKVEFTGSKVTGKHDGGFKQFSGSIDAANNKPEDSKVSVEIDMNSIYTDTEDLTGHLKSKDFFEVEKFPKATFNSTKIVPDAERGAGNYTVTGDFDLHGQKKSITFPAKITMTDSQVEVNTEFAINRKDFGIIYAGKTDDLIRDDVVIRLDLKSPRKK